jgi:hypothetical protein
VKSFDVLIVDRLEKIYTYWKTEGIITADPAYTISHFLEIWCGEKAAVSTEI